MMGERQAVRRRRAMRGLRAAVLSAVVALSLAGCAYHRQTTGMAVDYNEFVAQTTNRQTVLNILRASQREPMHFTSFSEIVGTVRGSGQLGVGVAANGDTRSLTTATNSSTSGAVGAVAATAASVGTTALSATGATNVTPSVSLMVSTGTDFKVAANATDEFYKGVLTSVPAPVIVSYLRQNFSAELLSHLLLNRLEFSARITPPGAPPYLVYLATAENQPDGGARDFVDAIACRKLDYAETTSRPAAIEADDLKAFGTLTADQLGRVTSRRDAGGLHYSYQPASETGFGLTLSEPASDAACAATRHLLEGRFREWLGRAGPRAAARAAAPAPTPGGRLVPLVQHEEPRGSGDDRPVRSAAVKVEGGHYFDQYLPAGWTGDLVIDLTIRPVEGILYYLGEYVRRPEAPLVDCYGTPCPVLVIRPLAELREVPRFVEVSYRGERYGVPLSGKTLSAAAGRSSQTIDLVQQLLNLNRSAKDLPSTPLVRVYN